VSNDPPKSADDTGEDPDDRDAIENAAAEWVIRLSGKPTAADKTAFRDWVQQDPFNQQTFDEAWSAWSSAGLLKKNPGDLRRVVSPPGKKGLPGKAIALLVLIGACGSGYFGNPFDRKADYRTGKGELRTISLMDGSKVELGPETAINLHFNTALREVELLGGNAYFQVTPRQGSEERPFSVVAANGRTTALGTEFSIDDKGTSADVTSVQHQIEVNVDRVNGGASIKLSPGEQVHYDAARLGNIVRVDLDKATAWRRGLLVFDDIPLREVISILNHYTAGSIVITNGELSEKRVSGVFKTSNIGYAVDTIAAELGARQVSALSFVTILY